MKRELIVGGFVVICVTGVFLPGIFLFRNDNQKSGSDGAGENTTSVVENGLKFTMNLDKTEFSPGENIDVNLVVQNLRDENVTFTFSSGYQFDFVVYDEDSQVVCSWSDDKAFIQEITHFSLGPGESRNWVGSWNQTVYNGLTGEYLPISSGTYYLRGILVGYLETPLLRITIS